MYPTLLYCKGHGAGTNWLKPSKDENANRSFKTSEQRKVPKNAKTSLSFPQTPPKVLMCKMTNHFSYLFQPTCHLINLPHKLLSVKLLSFQSNAWRFSDSFEPWNPLYNSGDCSISISKEGAAALAQGSSGDRSSVQVPRGTMVSLKSRVVMKILILLKKEKTLKPHPGKHPPFKPIFQVGKLRFRAK